MSNIQISGKDVLSMTIHSVKEAESLLQKADFIEGVSFWMKGKAWKHIKDSLDERSFREYFRLAPTGSSRQHALRLAEAYELVEKLRAEGMPDNELPRSEHACRVYLHGKKMPKDKAKVKVDMEMAKEASSEAYHNSDSDIVEEIMEEQAIESEKKAVQGRNDKLTKKPKLAQAVNDLNLADKVKEASNDAGRLDDKLKAIILMAKGIGENGDFSCTERHYNRSIKQYSERNETLNKILGK